MDSTEENATNRTSLLSEYDQTLLVDRFFIPLPRDGFQDEDEAFGKESERFEPLRTVWLVSFYSCLVLIYIVVYLVHLLLVIFGNADEKHHDNAIIIAAGAHVLLLVVAGGMEGFIRLQHRRRQSLGYLDFYRQTRKLLPIPFQTAAYSVAAMLVIVTMSRRAEDEQQTRYYVFAVSVVEGLVLLTYDVLYIKRVLKHNRTETLPDAQQYLEAPLTTAPDTRRRTRDAVVDHQVEFIRCLQEQRDTLRSEVTRLTSMLGEAGKDMDSNICKDDAEHLLVAGEQLMRALRAEAETLKKESDCAAKLVNEKMEEIHRLQELLVGQNKENNRLRATLAEWSKRNAKLEQKLIEATGMLEQVSKAPPIASGTSNGR
ncbi:hypothetical protein BSKO_09104 [Bryopsis sp. KO-2023]|nr:hypothetical protein BSKO_09104 [Bryopsis sp. KO-2023]